MNNDEIQRLYDTGLSTYQLAKRFGCSAETIRRRLKKLRSNAEANRAKDPEVIKKIKASCRKRWQGKDYRARVEQGRSRPGYLEDISKNTKKTLSRPEVRAKIQKASQANSDKISTQAKERWQDGVYREKQQVHFASRAKKASEASVRILQEDTKKRAQWISRLRKSSTDKIVANGFVSTAQKQLYYILEQSGVDFCEEGEDTRISPFYVVDCIVPKQGKMDKDLIIEVQGEYWHELKHVKLKDTQKRTYIERHTDYNLMYLSELEVRNWDSVKNKLNNYGIKLVEHVCRVSDLVIKRINETQTQLFYSIFHYSSSVRKGAITFGVYYDDQLVAAISYSNPIRQQVASSLGHQLNEVLEISRMARTTNLRCKNLLSWLISKTIKQLSRDVRIIVSYSDETYHHDGTVYKASNFRCDKQLDEDYFYVDHSGARFHKKTIWDSSKKMKMSERDYANKHNLQKIYGGKKKRWLFYRFKYSGRAK